LQSKAKKIFVIYCANNKIVKEDVLFGRGANPNRKAIWAYFKECLSGSKHQLGNFYPKIVVAHHLAII